MLNPIVMSQVLAMVVMAGEMEEWPELGVAVVKPADSTESYDVLFPADRAYVTGKSTTTMGDSTVVLAGNQDL